MFRSILRALPVAAVLVATVPVAANASPYASMDVEYSCADGAWLVTSSKYLSNVVVSDGQTEVKTEFDDGNYSALVGDADVTTIWVKSGKFRSGDGPGYGQRFDVDAPDCGPVDADGDGYTTADDCDDDDAAVNPGAVDTPNDGIDQNCDGSDLVVGDGQVRVTLTWDTDDDLDLHVVDPAGDRLWYGNRSVPSGGELDRDDNVGVCGSDDLEPGGVENVYWPADGAPSGSYVIEVDNFNDCDGLTSGTYTLQVFLDDVLVEEHSGSTGDNLGAAFSGEWLVYQTGFAVS